MSLKLVLFISLLIPSINTAAEGHTSQTITDVAGFWISSGGEGLIEIVQSSGTAAVWLRRTLKPEYDLANPDKSKRDRLLRDVLLGDGFVLQDSEWRGGRLYDPESGRTYRARLTRISEDTLRVRGYLGLPALGKTEEWQSRTAFIARLQTFLGSGDRHE